MEVINARNVNDAYVKAHSYLTHHGIYEQTRNGPVKSSPGPVVTVYTHPDECVLFAPDRDANPFFHCMEAVWMLAGRNDVASIARYNSNMPNYSDDGETFHGAYGHRWRQWFSYDQLHILCEHLRKEPTTRRAVLGMWDPKYDLLKAHSGNSDGSEAKDLPCNTHVYFRLAPGNLLDMTVCNRSNDAMWGAYGSNAVHFSFLHQYVAAATNSGLGLYTHMTNNLHWYLDKMPEQVDYEDHYQLSNFHADDIFDDWGNFDYEADQFLKGYFDEWTNPWISETLEPMKTAWRAHKGGMRRDAMMYAGKIESADWRHACMSWLDRRYTRRGEG